MKDLKFNMNEYKQKVRIKIQEMKIFVDVNINVDIFSNQTLLELIENPKAIQQIEFVTQL